MATDVAIKAIDANTVEFGAIVVGVTKQGSYQRVDANDELGANLDDDAWYNKLQARYDNPNYYTA
jgi:hypothetical protein